jgi:glyoxylase-like metal-dependent hydrolase (beta-lactamase superfamily II)
VVRTHLHVDHVGWNTMLKKRQVAPVSFRDGLFPSKKRES